MSQRIAKVESLVRQTVAPLLVELMGKEGALVTVTAVDVSPDLRHSSVWVGSVNDDEAVFERVLEQRPELQRQLASVMTTKFVPKISLRHDAGGRYADHINRLLHDN
ncbi:MAG TPA: ribosome-binding factor A [Candidatus Nanoarchaeia archaeon]|nr:ribosome-binding factor A [Candidatus Nanoarchaeia archaeon]